MELDLDMDDDDPTMQTRFSGHLSPNNEQALKAREEAGRRFTDVDRKKNEGTRRLGTITDENEALEDSEDS